MRVPVTGKVFTEEDKQALIDCINSGEEITYGSYNVKFEKMLAKYTGVSHAFFVNSGSSANLLAFAAFTSPDMYEKWRVQPGDEIITLAAGFPTTVAPIVQYGCVPVFVDIDRDTYNIDISYLEEARSSRTRGVFIAHTLGNPFAVKTVKDFCTRHNLFLIEDACDALGSEYDHQKCGSFGDVSTYSFYPAHHITTGQGGAVLTSDPLIAKIIRSMRGWGKECVCPPNQDDVCGRRFTQQHGKLPFGYDHKYVFSNFGYNLQGTNLLAALGCSQMKHIEEFSKRRRDNFEVLKYALRNTRVGMMEAYASSYPAWFGFPILLPNYLIRRDIVNQLSERGIETRTLFAGNIIKQPCFTKNSTVKYRQVGDLYNTDLVMDQMFWTGVWHGLSPEQIDYLAKSLVEVL